MFLGWSSNSHFWIMRWLGGQQPWGRRVEQKDRNQSHLQHRRASTPGLRLHLSMAFRLERNKLLFCLSHFCLVLSQLDTPKPDRGTTVNNDQLWRWGWKLGWKERMEDRQLSLYSHIVWLPKRSTNYCHNSNIVWTSFTHTRTF